MNTDNLFLKTLEDIGKKMSSGDGYEIFMIAPLLRKLLLDDAPLMDQVNSKYGLKIKFIINNRPIRARAPGLFFYSMQDGFDPDTSVPHLAHPLEVTRDGLLKAPIMVLRGEVINVHDLIGYICHVGGAVHAGKLKSVKHAALGEIQETIGIQDLPAGVRAQLAISRVVLKGLAPLKEAILAG